MSFCFKFLIIKKKRIEFDALIFPPQKKNKYSSTNN